MTQTTEPKVLIDLAERIANGRAVAFVGAGASMSSGLPGWTTLLHKCIAYIETTAPQQSLARRRLQEGDHLVAAELIQSTLGTHRLAGFLRKLLNDTQAKPSPLHYGLARLPFRLVITTNFDNLLEKAYIPSLHAIHTWLDGEDIYNKLLDGSFFILKSHGDVNKTTSLVLTRSEFRDQIQSATADSLRKGAIYREALRSIVLNNTLLFVGHSLRDLDLLHLLDECHSKLGPNAFGPHYAILAADEIDHNFVEYLKRSFNIIVIPFAQETAAGATSNDKDVSTVPELLTTLSGLVSHERTKHGFNLTFDTRYFLQRNCKHILNQACNILGTNHGAICLTINRRIPKLQYIEIAGQQDARRNPLDDVSYHDDLGMLYLSRKRDKDWLVTALDSGTKLGENRDHAPETMKTRLACPIYCDGQREGVISVESALENAFTDRHVTALNVVARWVGISLFEARQRILVSELLLPYTENIEELAALIYTSRLFNEVDLRFILYRPRYIEGKLEGISKHRVSGIGPFFHAFDGISLAASVLENRTRIEIEDADVELTKSTSVLSRDGVRAFGIRGPVVGVPVRSLGYTAGVLVAWSGHGKNCQKQWRYVPERLERIASLIANDPSLSDLDCQISARTFLDSLNAGLLPIDEGKSWSADLLKRDGDKIIRTLCRALIQRAGIQRVRVWQSVDGLRSDTDDVLFTCVFSCELSAEGKWSENAYQYRAVWSNDIYCHYTIHRAAHDPLARTQHRSMFGGNADPNCGMLRKDPDGYWTVGPIVGNGRTDRLRPDVKLMGFVSCDNHCVLPDLSIRDRPVPASVRAFQRSAIDVVTDLLYLVLSFNPTTFGETVGQLLTRDGPLKS